MSTSLPFTQSPTDPALKDVLDQLQKSIFLSLNCHHVATIQSFNAAKQTATASINYKKTYYQLNAVTGLYSPVLVDYPALIDCPVICLGGASSALTFPIAKGDECLVLFNDRDIDNWFNGATGAAVATPRLHSFADGVILVGLRSLGKVLTAYDTTRAVLRNGTTLVGVGSTLVKIANNQYVLGPVMAELCSDIQDLITNIKSLVSATSAITVLCAAPASPSGPPINVAAITAVTTQLTTTANAFTATANKIAGLLE